MKRPIWEKFGLDGITLPDLINVSLIPFYLHIAYTPRELLLCCHCWVAQFSGTLHSCHSSKYLPCSSQLFHFTHWSHFRGLCHVTYTMSSLNRTPHKEGNVRAPLCVIHTLSGHFLLCTEPWHWPYIRKQNSGGFRVTWQVPAVLDEAGGVMPSSTEGSWDLRAEPSTVPNPFAEQLGPALQQTNVFRELTASYQGEATWRNEFYTKPPYYTLPT